MVSFEILHYLKRKQVGKDGYMAFKLDLSKAYDRVDWHFLCAMLTRLDFADKWVRLIYGCLSMVQYKIVSSGRTLQPIMPSKGLRQEDPIFPYLFFVCAEGFLALIRRSQDKKWIHGCKVADGAPTMSHMLFAYDSFLYCKATDGEDTNILKLLDMFATASGQQAKFQKRIQSWDNKFLSRAGKEVLIKSVVQALPAYTMNVFLIPAGSFLSATLGSNPSYIWKSVFEAQELVRVGVRRVVGNGTHINILSNTWLQDDVNPYIESSHPALVGNTVDILMKIDSLEWDEVIVSDVLNERDHDLVLKIPLSSLESDAWSRVPGVADAPMTFTSWFEEGLDSWNEAKFLEASMIFNVDGALFSNERQFGVGLVARTAVGLVLQAKTLNKVGALQPHVVEVIGIKETLSWIKANGWTSVIVDSDCLKVISDLQRSKYMASPYSHILSDCKALLSDFDAISFNFVKQSANKIVHALARSSLDEAHCTFSGVSLPTVIVSLVLDDLN
uniref:Reverse transcriptase n=1 Tax=Cannabis sativa TaxID=3483 RepID=A0A803PBQ1_CANSA